MTWLLTQPKATNPATDLTGARCGSNQPLSGFWYLAGFWGVAPVSPVRRTCTIPAGRTLFFPLVNAVYASFETDPDATRTEAYGYTQLSTFLFQQSNLTLLIDGVAVSDLKNYFTVTKTFMAILPSDNLFNSSDYAVPAGTICDPTVGSGFYVALTLPAGVHTIELISALPLTDGSVFPQHILYNLNVMGPASASTRRATTRRATTRAPATTRRATTQRTTSRPSTRKATTRRN